MKETIKKSKGHLFFDTSMEYYIGADGHLYRAPLTTVIDINTHNRIGRWVTAPHTMFPYLASIDVCSSPANATPHFGQLVFIKEDCERHEAVIAILTTEGSLAGVNSDDSRWYGLCFGRDEHGGLTRFLGEHKVYLSEMEWWVQPQDAPATFSPEEIAQLKSVFVPA